LLGGAVFWFDVPLELDDDDDDDGNSGGCFDQQGTQATCQTTGNDSESFDSVQQEREAQDQFVAEGSLSVFAGSATSSGVKAPGIDSDARKPLSSPREVKTLLLPCATAPRTRSLSGRSKRWRQAPRSTSWGSSKSLSSTGTESPRQSPLNSPTGSDSWGSPRFFPPHFFKDVEEELEKPKLEAEEEAQAEKVFPASSRRVLVVDDSVMLQKLLKASLTRLDYQVETAKNGREALEKMTKGSEPYLVVLMDFLMPVLDGVSATAMFREWERTALENAASGALTQTGSRDADDIQLRPRQYVIGMSANAEAADIEAAKSAGMDLFMPKPVKVAEIAKHIARQGQLVDESKGTSRLACRI
jgi:CheY-like chemotaxis protein